MLPSLRMLLPLGAMNCVVSLGPCNLKKKKKKKACQSILQIAFSAGHTQLRMLVAAVKCTEQLDLNFSTNLVWHQQLLMSMGCLSRYSTELFFFCLQ